MPTAGSAGVVSRGVKSRRDDLNDLGVPYRDRKLAWCPPFASDSRPIDIRSKQACFKRLWQELTSLPNTASGQPWVMWECGVASGVVKECGLIPVVYAMEHGDLASPPATSAV